jgi:site-specific recombinase XerD
MPNCATQALQDLLLHIEGAYAPNTIRAYRAEMMEFIRYCQTHGMCALPASAQSVSDFLTEQMGLGLKYTSLRRKASSISAVHRLCNLPDPTKDAEVRIALRKIKRCVGVRQHQAYPINSALMRRMLDVTTDDLRGLRDRALLMLAYDSMRRRGELVSLRIEDIEFLDDQGASVLLRRSKTDQFGAGQWIHLSVPTTRAVEDWISAAGLSSGFILRSIRGRDNVLQTMSESRVNRTLKRLARRAQLTPTQIRQISGHSTRVGAAQDLLIAGASLPQIMVKGGWSKTDTVIRYIERVNPSLLASVDPRALTQAGPRRSCPS